VTVVAEQKTKRFGGGADARDGPSEAVSALSGSGSRSGVVANDVSKTFSSDGAADAANAPRRSFAATNQTSGSEPRRTLELGESKQPLSRYSREEKDGETERKKTVRRTGDAERVRLDSETRDARRARRAALRREVSALQRLKLRLEKVRDALVRKAKVDARANGEGEEDE
jgi:hypothetical protein